MSQAQNVHVKPELRLKGASSAMESRILGIGILALFIVAIMVFGIVSANQDLDVSSSGAGRSINPELSAAQRFAEVNPEALERDDLAINPEMKSVLNASETVGSDETVDSMAINPEVYFAQRYAESVNDVRERENVWEANP